MSKLLWLPNTPRCAYLHSNCQNHNLTWYFGYYYQLYVDRQKLSVAGSKAALDSDAKLSAVGVQDGGEVLVKDLGPQIAWRTVFLIEYVGYLL